MIDRDDINSLAAEWLWRYGTYSRRLVRKNLTRHATRLKRGPGVTHTSLNTLPDWSLPTVPPAQPHAVLLHEILPIIDAMPPRQRAAIIMAALGYSYREIAKHLPAALDSVRLWIHQARATLQHYVNTTQ